MITNTRRSSYPSNISFYSFISVLRTLNVYPCTFLIPVCGVTHGSNIPPTRVRLVYVDSGYVRTILEIFECLRGSTLSRNPLILEFFFAQVKWFGMIIDCFDTRSSPSKLLAIVQLSQPPTLGEIPVLLGGTGFVRKFIPNYSSVAASISDLLRDPRFQRQRSRRSKISRGQAQVSMEMAVDRLIYPPILVPPTGARKLVYRQMLVRQEPV